MFHFPTCDKVGKWDFALPVIGTFAGVSPIPASVKAVLCRKIVGKHLPADQPGVFSLRGENVH